MNNRQNPVAIVTGGGSGIGQSVALALIQNGFDVTIAGRRQSTLEETQRLVSEQNRHSILIVETDVACPESVQNLFDRTVARFGRVDLLFNNAGINIPSCPVEEVQLEDWQSIINVNMTGILLCTQAAIRVMKAQQPRGGRIINNGSISAHVPRPGSIGYTATKHAVTGITKSTALDCRNYDIACGQIDIGNAETSMVAKMKSGVPQADGSIAVEPTMDPQAVADAVVYMARLPLTANVPFMTVMATHMPYIGRG